MYLWLWYMFVLPQQLCYMLHWVCPGQVRACTTLSRKIPTYQRASANCSGRSRRRALVVLRMPRNRRRHRTSCRSFRTSSTCSRSDCHSSTSPERSVTMHSVIRLRHYRDYYALFIHVRHWRGHCKLVLTACSTKNIPCISI